MKLIRETNLREFADSFWKRQADKSCSNDAEALSNIQQGGPALKWHVNLYPYKLPKLVNDLLLLEKIETGYELNELMIYDRMLCDDWMKKRFGDLLPKTRRLGHLAEFFLSRGYFEKDWPDTQAKLFKEWKDKSSLEGLIDEAKGLPLVQMTWPGEYEIVDGWGRLLAMAALLRKGLEFSPFKCFVATRKTRADERAASQ